MLTLTQLYELGISNGVDIYEGITLPAGSPLDRSTLINSIIMRCGLNFPNFADPHVMASAITVWSAKNQYTFEHIAKIYEASYSPIENYDRYEDMSTNLDRNLKDDTTSNGVKKETTKTGSTTNFNNSTTHTGFDTTDVENTTSAYDSGTYQPDNKSTTTYTPGASDNVSGSSTVDQTTTKNATNDIKTNKGVTENEKTTQKNHIRGNIGVTTATQMESEEYEFIKNYNPYDFIAGLFENDLTLYVF